ncbi:MULTISPECIES: cysteine/O-acetylserine transporter [Aeromonas]|jgi:cysteine/O-acetylserine efflux protein|uniref:cysteine/O-acetylserine transporter n=1 Tax=Aeromonas TaxID=642 RepID=UPI001495A626|nr:MULTISPECIES: cysteine/O-acetylserine transporter [Aeromonas]MBA8781228.1 cysteine/O-acetylserine transporter [Aeromonas caviae]MBA8785283.1 cysteine/O-acetylserine transporter [Aeromonas sp. TW 6]MDH0309248.1 cysteine/O-acetylserine transporter [Aeromonas caviae]
MTTTLVSAFLTYTLITAMTPGPNNILALSAANQHGLRRSSRVLAGMSAGFLLIMLLCALFTFTLISLSPALVGWLSWAGAAYVLWLAWRIAASGSNLSSTDGALPGFWTSFWLQFVNVKIILYGITALSTFVLPHTTEFVWVLGVSLLLALIGTLGNLCWALAGHLLQPLFQRHGRILNLTLAALLVYCALRMLI